VTSALFQRLRYKSAVISLSHVVADYYLGLSVSVMSHNTPVTLLTNFRLVPGHTVTSIPRTYVSCLNLDAIH